MTIDLVTGGSGFIGRHLVDELVADGTKVRILDLEPPDRHHTEVDYVEGSITDEQVVRRAMNGVRHVYHAAGISDLWLGDPSLFHSTHVDGTRVVFEAACDAAVERVVHTSSATVLIDDTLGQRPVTLDESYRTSERHIIGHYARSKWQAEQVAFSFADRLPIVAVLPTLPLGPGDRRLTPPGRMLLNFLNGTNRAYTDCILNIIDVRDVAAGHRLACRRGRPGQRYLLNRHSLSMASFLGALEELTDRTMPKWRIPGSAALVFSALDEFWASHVSCRTPIAPLAGTRMSLRPVTFSSDLAEAEFGLPTTPLVKTLSDAAAWLADDGHLPDERGSTVMYSGR